MFRVVRTVDGGQLAPLRIPNPKLQTPKPYTLKKKCRNHWGIGLRRCCKSFSIHGSHGFYLGPQKYASILAGSDSQETTLLAVADKLCKPESVWHDPSVEVERISKTIPLKPQITVEYNGY